MRNATNVGILMTHYCELFFFSRHGLRWWPDDKPRAPDDSTSRQTTAVRALHRQPTRALWRNGRYVGSSVFIVCFLLASKLRVTFKYFHIIDEQLFTHLGQPYLMIKFRVFFETPLKHKAHGRELGACVLLYFFSRNFKHLKVFLRGISLSFRMTSLHNRAIAK